MRRGAVSSSRALAEQATVSEQLARVTESLTRQTASLSRAMHDQAGAVVQVSGELDNIRKQAEQGERALTDQARAMKGTDRREPEYGKADQVDQRGEP
jgi:methyl-accepting chemotaxis protein